MKSLQNDYIKRLSHFQKVQLIEVSEALSKQMELSKIKREEAQSILNHIKDDDFVVTLDLRGRNLDSIELSNAYESWVQRNVVFIIGGSWGVDDSIVERSNFLWKLSDLTFPHLLVRLILCEQLYRSQMILNNHPYHK